MDAQRVAIVGLGLIGGSLFLRLAEAGAIARGYDTDAATREAARAALTGRADVAGRDSAQVTGTLDEAVADAHLVVLAVPLPAVGPVLDAVAATGYAGLLTDVTSVKAPVRTLARDRCPAATWVGGHPMAGRESSGFGAADAALLDGCAWVLCLEDDTDLDAWLRLAGWVTRLGARVLPATADGHDAAVARVSHVPHLVAAALARAAGAAGPPALALGAGSFRDGTRVAATRPELVAAMCGGNAEAVAAALDRLLADLGRARALLDTDDPAWHWHPGSRSAMRPAWHGRPPRTRNTGSPPPGRRCATSAGPVAGSPPSAPPTTRPLRPRSARPRVRCDRGRRG